MLAKNEGHTKLLKSYFKKEIRGTISGHDIPSMYSHGIFFK